MSENKYLCLFLCAILLFWIAMVPVAYFSGKRSAYSEWDAAIGSLEQQFQDESAFAACLHEQWSRQRERVSQ